MDRDQLFINMALQAWNTHVSRVEKLFDGLTDDQLSQEIAPGKNRISYVIGHLVAIHDRMIELFGLGNRSYRQLDAPFVDEADRTVAVIPDASELKTYWKKCHAELSAYFNTMSADDWFSKHSLVSDKEFAAQPERNKLNVLINRTNHLAYHYGQMVLIK